MPGHEILPLAEAHFAQLHRVFDHVCQETGFMAFTKAPPREETFACYPQSVNAGGRILSVCVRAGLSAGAMRYPLARDT